MSDYAQATPVAPLRRQGEPKGLKVFIARPPDVSEHRLERHQMLLKVLSSLGCESALVDERDPKVLEADVLLMVGDCLAFEGFYKRLHREKAPRPTTVLWQKESLPPPELSEGVEEAALRAADNVLLAKRLLAGPWKRLKSSLPESARARLKRAFISLFFLGFPKEIVDSPKEAFGELDDLHRNSMMERYGWFKRRWAEGYPDYVFTSSRPKARFLSTRGVPATFVPMGYHKSMGEDVGAERDIDCVFIGTLECGRRRRVLDGLARSLASRGVSLATVDRGCFAKERSDLLNRARISVNLSNSSWDLPGVRFLLSMGCGAMVVSEPLDDPEPYLEGVHFVQAEIEKLPDVIAHYLSYVDERRAIVRSAHDFITRELTLENSISRIMRVCREDSAI